MNELRSELSKIDNIIEEIEEVSYYLDDVEEDHLYRLLNRIKEEVQDFLSIKELANMNQRNILFKERNIKQ